MEDVQSWAKLLRENPSAFIELQHARSHVTIVEPDGTVTTRTRGGPIHSMGHLDNFELKTVRVARARVPLARHRAMIAGLVDASFPEGKGPDHLVPDEIPSFLTLRHPAGTASMSANHSALQANLPLRLVFAELEGLTTVLKSGPATGSLDNPEREEWARVRDRPPIALDEGGTVAPDAGARAQKAVEAFYAQHFDALCKRLRAR